MVEGKKFLSSDLIAKEFLMAQGLSIWVEDPDIQIIDEYSNPDAQYGNPFSFFTLAFFNLT